MASVLSGWMDAAMYSSTVDLINHQFTLNGDNELEVSDLTVSYRSTAVKGHGSYGSFQLGDLRNSFSRLNVDRACYNVMHISSAVF